MVYAPDATCSGTWIGFTGVSFASVSVLSTAVLAAALLLVPHLRRRLSTRLALVLALSLGLTWAAGIANYALDCPAWSVCAAALGLIATMLWQLVLALDFASVALRPAARGSADALRSGDTACITTSILLLFRRCTYTDSRRVERLYHCCVWGLTIVLGVPLVLYVWFRVYASSLASTGGAVHRESANSTAAEYGGCGSLFVMLLKDDGGAVFYGYNITLLLIELVLCCVVVTLRTRCFGALRGAHGMPLLVMDWRQRERVVVTTRMLLAFVIAWAPFIISNGARLRGMHTLPCWLQAATATLFCGQGLILFVIFGFGRPHYAVHRFASKVQAKCCRRELSSSSLLTSLLSSASPTSTSPSGLESASAGLLTFDDDDGHLACGDGGYDGAGAVGNGDTEAGTLTSLEPLLSGAHSTAALADFRERDSFIAPDRFCLDPRDVQCEAQPFAAGGGGMIYHGLYSGHRVCIKQLYVQVMDPLAVDDFLREASMLAKLRHKHIVHMWGICIIRNASSQRIGIVMELCTGSLRDAIPAARPAPKLPPGALAAPTPTTAFAHVPPGSAPRSSAVPGPACPGFLRIMQQLTRTMADVHAQQVCHRDLKPDNVLMVPANDDDWPGDGSGSSTASAAEFYDIRICDWGTSRLLGHTGTMPRHAIGGEPLPRGDEGTESGDGGGAPRSHARTRDMSLIGTPGFAPPEVMTATVHTASCDAATAQPCGEQDQWHSRSSASSRASSGGCDSFGSDGSATGQGVGTSPRSRASRAARSSGGLGSQASYDGCAWDVYTVAVTMWFCYAGRDPYVDLPNSGDISRAVCAGRRPPLSDVPPRLAELLERMWHANPEARPCMADVANALQDSHILDFD